MAARYGHDAMVGYLCGATSIDHINHRPSGLGLFALGEAAKCGHASTVALLLKNKADVNVRSTKGQTALHQAAASGHAKCARLCCYAGADVQAVDDEGRCAAQL